MVANKPEEINTSKTITRKLIFENILNADFVLSVIIPVILFSVLDYYKMTLQGTIAAGLWSIGVIAIQLIQKKQVNIFASIGAGLSAIALIGTIISQNPMFYLASPIVIDLMLAAVFLGSVAIKKPIIQVLAEYTVKEGFTEELRKKPKYKAAWMIVSSAWGVLSISQALIRIILLYSVSYQVYYTISTIYGNISSPLLLVFSFWFPGWYWKRIK